MRAIYLINQKFYLLKNKLNKIVMVRLKPLKMPLYIYNHGFAYCFFCSKIEVRMFDEHGNCAV